METATKHTPGPWELVVENDPRGQPSPMYRGLIAFVESSPDRRLAIVDPIGNTVSHEDWLANARLIAAAPALLEALEAMVDNANWDKVPQTEAEFDAMIVRAETAICLAKEGK